MLSEVVTLSDEWKGVRREVGCVGFDEAGRDRVFGGGEECLAEGKLAGRAGGRRG